MAGLLNPQVLVVFSAIVALNCASTLPRDIIFPATNENNGEHSEPMSYPSSENNQPLKILEQEDKPKGCFHFYVSRNMSSLLAEATKMLRTIRDRREREWILTFIYRIKSLAEHLRAHPDSRNYDCLPIDEEEKKRILSDNLRGQPQPELYFVDDVPKRSNDAEDSPEKSDEKNNQEPVSIPTAGEEQSLPSVPPKEEPDFKPPSSSQPQTESSAEIASDSTLGKSADDQRYISANKLDATVSSQDNESAQRTEVKKEALDKRERVDDGSIVLSSVPECDSPTDCHTNKVHSPSQNSAENYFADAGNIYPFYQSDDTREQEINAAEMYQKELLKERIRKALLEELAPEIKKLKTVGGSENDLVSIWNSNYVQEDKSIEENEAIDFDYEETGAAAGDLNLNEKMQPDRTVAPSLDEVQNSKENSKISKDSSSYEPYDDSDVLVQQLFDVRYNNPPSKTTKSLSDQNNEYLITSTHTPF